MVGQLYHPTPYSRLPGLVLVEGGEAGVDRLVEGLAPCLAGSGQLAGRRGTGLPGRDPGLREALAVCTPPAPEPSAKRPGS